MLRAGVVRGLDLGGLARGARVDRATTGAQCFGVVYDVAAGVAFGASEARAVGASGLAGGPEHIMGASPPPPPWDDDSCCGGLEHIWVNSVGMVGVFFSFAELGGPFIPTHNKK